MNNRAKKEPIEEPSFQDPLFNIKITKEDESMFPKQIFTFKKESLDEDPFLLFNPPDITCAMIVPKIEINDIMNFRVEIDEMKEQLNKVYNSQIQ
mmetsp:Transcript_25274/g.22395  ORF Transcript_25274/g.22395 Transcript_25274/m.22395 type:complete len:95 (+) Transcript_25274:453-737(+)